MDAGAGLLDARSNRDRLCLCEHAEQSRELLEAGARRGRVLEWGDTHHPAISETNGDYDGQYLFINDKANPRMAVIDLHDFETKQIVTSKVFQSEHGGAFVSENTEYIIEAAQLAAPLGGEYAPLEQFNEMYRGGVTYWKFNREKGRLEPENSFTIEAPPYSQDLSDFGKLASSGFSFTNSFCSERYVGGIERGRPPFEAGCSAKDTDYLHVINLNKAAELAAAGNTFDVNGFPVIGLQTSIDEQIAAQEINTPPPPPPVRVVLVNKLLFESGSARLSEEGKRLLSKLTGLMQDEQYPSVRVQGHTDDHFASLLNSSPSGIVNFFYTAFICGFNGNGCVCWGYFCSWCNSGSWI